MDRGPLRRAGLALLVSAVAMSGLGLSGTFYACPMEPEPSARPCCPDVAGEPAPEHTISATPCCRATHVEVAPATDRLTAPDARPVMVAALPITIAPPPARPLAAPLAQRPTTTHGPPPLERTSRLLI